MTLASRQSGALPFSPHITLYSPLPARPISELVTRFRDLPYSPLDLTLLPAQKGSHYFQSILAPVKPIESLLKLRRACEDAYGEIGDYFPHLSLLYGDLSPERRDKLVEMVNTNHLGPEIIQNIKVEEAWFVDCSGPEDQWRVVEQVKL